MSSYMLLGAVEDASQARSGVLTPTSEGSSNRHHEGRTLSPDHRRRKRMTSVTMEHLLKPLITVKPHPSNLHMPPRVLHPLMLLPREYLPLSCMDFAASSGDFPQSRFYESHIKILDLESRMDSASVVLIARNESRGIVYAVERHRNGLYVLCKLGSWVDLDDLAKDATAVLHDRLCVAKQEQRESLGIDAIITPQMHYEQKKKKAAIEAIQSMVKKRPRSRSGIPSDDKSNVDSPLEPELTVSRLPSPDINPGEAPQSQVVEKQPDAAPLSQLAEEQDVASQNSLGAIFDNIRTHYFDALYKSMRSLAYFAKGPLSRARSTFHLDIDGTMDMADLIGFLKSLILTTVQIDKKYRETVPDIIARMKNNIESSDEGSKKKRKPKKMKIGKDGLYPMEDDYIRQWWTVNMPEQNEEEAAGLSDSQIKSHITILRTRETQLQMILILEILALEPLKAAEHTGENSLPTLPGAPETQEQLPATPAPPKKRNRHNLPVLLDVHADRLTIWQSTASDEQLLLADSQSARVIVDGGAEKRSSSEPLKDFCVDVIVPFFASRLPGVCDPINRKLGGPAIIAPTKSKPAKRPVIKDQRPGSATKRPTPQSARKTLQRALSTDLQNRRSVSRGPSNAIALLRSATSTALPTIKREGSDISLFKTRSLSESQRGGAILSRSSSMSKLQDFKSQKKTAVDAELKDAISALRKPNRDVVGKAMAEADERRTSSLSVKKMRKPAKSFAASSIQVKATPANMRFKDMMPMQPPTTYGTPLQSIEDVIPPSSTGPFIPSTGHRSTQRNLFQRKASPVLDTVGDTPIKAVKHSFIRRPANEEPAIPPSSPLMERRQTNLDNMFVPGSILKKRKTSGAGAYGGEGDIFATPVKKAPRLDYAEAAGTKTPIQEKKVSIYDKLGWDDDVDDLL